MTFFPFDLTGPQFLVFYPVFVLGFAVLVRYLLTRREAALETAPPHLTDPYRIALLRDGRREAVRIAVLSLVERGLLAVKPDKSIVVADGAPKSLGDSFEDAVLSFLTARGKSDLVAEDGLQLVAEDPRVNAATTAMQSELEAQGLLSTARERGLKMLPAVAFPLAIPVLRIHLSGPPYNFLGPPHGYLLLEMIGFAFLAAFIADLRLTALGRSALEHLEALFGQAIARARDLSTPAAGAEVTLLAATFGIATLSGIVAGQPEWLHSKIMGMRETLDFLRKRGRENGGCGSGCGGDGGCGGCGGCGG